MFIVPADLAIEMGVHIHPAGCGIGAIGVDSFFGRAGKIAELGNYAIGNSDIPAVGCPETASAVYETISKRLADDADPDTPLPEERAAAMHAKGKLDEGEVSVALAKGDRGFVIAALALASGLSRPAVQKVVSLASAKGIVAVVWRAGFGMGLAEQLQLRLARIAPDAVMHPAEAGGFPMSDDELDWQIEFFAS